MVLFKENSRKIGCNGLPAYRGKTKNSYDLPPYFYLHFPLTWCWTLVVECMHFMLTVINYENKMIKIIPTIDHQGAPSAKEKNVNPKICSLLVLIRFRWQKGKTVVRIYSFWMATELINDMNNSKYVWEVCDIIFGNVPDSLDGA